MDAFGGGKFINSARGLILVSFQPALHLNYAKTRPADAFLFIHYRLWLDLYLPASFSGWALSDDHAIVRAGIRGFLEHAGDIEVVAEAEDGETAKTLIQQYMPDVAVLDIQMPKASGIEVTRWVRANLRGIGLLTLTAYDDTSLVK